MLQELQICQQLAITFSENCINIISIWGFGFWRVLDCRKRLFLGVNDDYIPHVDQEIISHQMKDISPLPLRLVSRGQFKDMRETCEVLENCPVFKTPYPPCSSMSKVLPPPWTWVSKWTPLNQSIKRKHNPRVTITCYDFFSC